uniref:glutathione transferase n=1 Tax=Anthurium amnicola TaxID=1678845 RepID=A0A1D1YVS2_9ARAE
MVVKVYGWSRAVSPQRVMLCLLEKGVEFELVHVDLDTMEHKEPEYLAKQPFGKVPYVKDGDFELFESRAIMRYYAAKYENRGPKLLGRTLEERAVVEQWVDVEAMTYDALVFPIVFNLVIRPRLGLPADAAAARNGVEKLEEVLDVYEQRLSKTKYLAGDEFTLADLTHIPATSRLTVDAGLGCLFDNRKNLQAWWVDISSRPSWNKVVDMAG